jgi:hypothetical protein
MFSDGLEHDLRIFGLCAYSPGRDRPGPTRRSKIFATSTCSPLGLSSEFDSALRGELAIKGNGTYLFAEKRKPVDSDLRSLGALLMRQPATYEMTWTVDAQADNVFLNGRSVIGRLTVTPEPPSRSSCDSSPRYSSSDRTPNNR